MPVATEPAKSLNPMEEAMETEESAVGSKLTVAKAQEICVDKVVVHPLVLLSVVDHYSRMSKTGHVKRVVGVLLGTWRGRTLDVLNSFAVPFDEDERERDVWFLDHDYLENMFNMFRKVNAKETIVGWYHTGPKLHANDILVNEMLKQFCPNPILVIMSAKPKPLGLPTEAYIEVEEVHDDGTSTQKTFEYVPSEIGAEEAEEVGVEHLLRDIKDITAGTLSQRLTDQMNGLRGLESQLKDIHRYLTLVISKELPINHAIIYQLQNVLNLLPDVLAPDFTNSLNVQTNDQLLIVYLSSLARAVISLHNLIANKITLRDAEKKETEREKDGGGDKKDKDEKKDGEKGDKKDDDKKDMKDSKDKKADKTKK